MSTTGPTVTAVAILLPLGDGELPPLRGTPLSVHAARALAEAGVRLVGTETPWSELGAADMPVVLHDPRCPTTPAGFVADLVAWAADRVQVGVRPVTDTVKTVDGDLVGETLDRSSLLAVASPVVLPAAVARAVAAPDLSRGLADLVLRLRRTLPVDLVEAPSVGRRVRDRADVLVLEAAHPA